jgi:hypothetical protein
MKIQNKISMIQPVTIGWIMAFVYLCYGCSSHAQESNNLKAAKVRFSLPLMINGQLVNQADSFTIFYYHDAVVIRNTVKNSSSKLRFDTAGEFIGQDSITENKPTFSYYIYHRDSIIGLRYKSLKPGAGRSYPVDSFLIKYTFDKMGLYNDIYKDAVLTKSVFDPYDQVDQIVPKLKPDESYPDTVRLYYQKKSLFDGIDFALSPSLDSEKNKKLVRSRFIYNPRLPTKSSPMLPSMEIWFDLQIVDPTQDKELAAFLQQNIK